MKWWIVESRPYLQLRLESSDRQGAALINTAETPQAERAPLQYLWQPPKIDINVAVCVFLLRISPTCFLLVAQWRML